MALDFLAAGCKPVRMGCWSSPENVALRGQVLSAEVLSTERGPGSGSSVLSTQYSVLFSQTLSPEKAYDRAWAVTLLEQVITRLRDENAAAGKASLFEQLKPFLMAGQRQNPYAQAAAELGLSEGAVRVAVHRLRRRYRELLREEIAQTLSDPAQIEEEMQALFSAFGE